MMCCMYDIDFVEFFVNEDVGFMVFLLFVIGYLMGKYCNGVIFEGFCMVVSLGFGGCVLDWVLVVVEVYMEIV